jgi:hypothetical protein
MIAAEGPIIGLCRPVPAQTSLEVGSDRRQWAHSASCTTVMASITSSWRYILSTPSMVGEGKASGVLVAAASVWPPSRLAEGAAPLARAWVVVKSTIRILSAAAVVCLPASLFRRYIISYSALG